MRTLLLLLFFFLSLPLLEAARQQPTTGNIAIVPKNLGNDFFGLAFQGCKDAATRELNNNFKCWFNGTWDADVEGTIQIIEQLIEDDDCSAIVISVLDPIAYIPVINKGIAKGKPILTFDADAPDSNRLAYIGTDNYFMGRGLAKLLKETQPEGGRFGMVSGYGDNLSERVRGVRAVLDNTKWREVGVQPKNGMEDYDISLAAMWELVEEYPDINAIIGIVGLPMFNRTTDNWRHFVDSNSNVSTIMADTLPIQLEIMQQGYADGLVGQLPYSMGYVAAETVANVLGEASFGGVPLVGALPKDTILGTHQLEVLRVPADSNRTITAPTADLVSQGVPVREEFTGLSFLFVGAAEMSLQESVTFEEMIKDWYEAFFRTQDIQNVEVFNMKTSISYIRQDITESGNTITLDQKITYLALEGALEPEDYILLPYLNAQANREFATSLAAQISAFEGIQSPIARPILEASTNDNRGGKDALVIGLVSVTSVILVVTACFLYKNHSEKSPSVMMTHTSQESLSMANVHDDESREGAERVSTVFAIAECQAAEDPVVEGNGFPAYKDQVRSASRKKYPEANARPINSPNL